MGNDFSKRHEGYRDRLKAALSETPEPQRQQVYEVVEAIYVDCARCLLDNPTLFRRIQENARRLAGDAEDLSREHPAVRLLRDEANMYSALTKGENPHTDLDYVFGKVKYILVDQLGVKPENVQMESELIPDLGPDSLDIVEIGIEIDSELGIRIPDNDLAGFVTVGDIVNYVMEHGSSSEK